MDSQSFISVKEPLRSGFRVLRIPVNHVLTTKMSKGPRGDGIPALCLQFQAGHCTAGEHCRNVHVSSANIAVARSSCGGAPAADNILPTAAPPVFTSCCELHDREVAAPSQRLVTVNYKDAISITVALSSFAPTQALDSILESASTDKPVVVSHLKLCRLHMNGHCKLGTSCRNVHLCRRALSTTAPTAVVLPPITKVAEASTATFTPVPPPAFSLPSVAPRPPPTPPTRCSSPTTLCLRRFVRRWNNPNIRTSASTNDNTSIHASLEFPAGQQQSSCDAIRWVEDIIGPTPPPLPQSSAVYERSFAATSMPAY